MVGKARFNQLGNDLYWSYFDAEDGNIRWIGYDDRHWWDNVSVTERARTRVGVNSGRIYTIDFATGDVTAVSVTK